jgi:hypothetical protein
MRTCSDKFVDVFAAKRIFVMPSKSDSSTAVTRRVLVLAERCKHLFRDKTKTWWNKKRAQHGASSQTTAIIGNRGEGIGGACCTVESRGSVSPFAVAVAELMLEGSWVVERVRARRVEEGAEGRTRGKGPRIQVMLLLDEVLGFDRWKNIAYLSGDTNISFVRVGWEDFDPIY